MCSHENEKYECKIHCKKETFLVKFRAWPAENTPLCVSFFSTQGALVIGSCPEKKFENSRRYLKFDSSLCPFTSPFTICHPVGGRVFGSSSWPSHEVTRIFRGRSPFLLILSPQASGYPRFSTALLTLPHQVSRHPIRQLTFHEPHPAGLMGTPGI